MYDRYFVLDGFEKGVDAQCSGVLDPLVPVGVGGCGAASRDAKLHVLVRRAEVTDKISCELGVTSLKDCCWG